MKDRMFLEGKVSVVADGRMNNATVKKLWNSFTLTMGEICFEKGEECTFLMGRCAAAGAC